MCFACVQQQKLDSEIQSGYIKPNVIYEEMADSPDQWGGKAAGLARLRKLGMNIPATYVIPCVESLRRPKVTFREFIIQNYYNSSDYSETVAKKFAVRSGAPTSMPGMMETKLNVPYEGLADAVREVWDSYNSEHCKLYRETKEIPDQGTAVIIQEMVSLENRNYDFRHSDPNWFDTQYSGVAFTSDPNKPLLAGMYSPVVEYVEGFGDTLVGGNTTPTKLDKDKAKKPWMRELFTKLEEIHEEYGPSDVEWAVLTHSTHTDRYEVVMLQHRKLKFAPVSKDQMESARGEILFTGKSIGAPVRVTAEITTDPKLAPGRLLYADEFTPELYKAMMQAAGIVCKVGGETCHAAIVARELNKPAISGIPKLSLEVPLTLDGVDGVIRLAVQDDVDATHTVIEKTIDPTRCPDFSFITKDSWNANLLLPRVYLNMDWLSKGEITRERFDHVIGEVAKLFGTYFYIAVACEVRHSNSELYRSDFTKEDRMKYESLKASLSARGINLTADKSYDRNNFLKREIQPPTDIHAAIANMAACRTLYTEFKWSRSFGGPKWGGIADMVYSYLHGELTPMLFVDACFNLVHNGGCAFNKFGWLQAVVDLLNAQLDAKRIGDLAAVIASSSYSRGFVIDYAKQDNILPQTQTEAVAA